MILGIAKNILYIYINISKSNWTGVESAA